VHGKQRGAYPPTKCRVILPICSSICASLLTVTDFNTIGYSALFTSSADTLQNEIISLCGGENIFTDSRVPWPQISREQVLRRQPQLIVITGQSTVHVKNFWLPQLKLPVIALNKDWFNRAGPRSLLAAEQLCSQLATFLAQ